MRNYDIDPSPPLGRKYIELIFGKLCINNGIYIHKYANKINVSYFRIS